MQQIRQNLKQCFAPHTFELEFQRPKIDCIRNEITRICMKEKMQLTDDYINNIIQGTNCDMRRILNKLEMIKVIPKVEMELSTISNVTMKNSWDVIRKVFTSTPDTKNKTIDDKINLFFYDTNMIGLFVQENYLNTQGT